MDKIIYIAGILFVAEFLLVVGLIAYIYFRARYLHRKREKKLSEDKKKEEYRSGYFDAINKGYSIGGIIIDDEDSDARKSNSINPKASINPKIIINPGVGCTIRAAQYNVDLSKITTVLVSNSNLLFYNDLQLLPEIVKSDSFKKIALLCSEDFGNKNNYENNNSNLKTNNKQTNTFHKITDQGLHTIQGTDIELFIEDNICDFIIHTHKFVLAYISCSIQKKTAKNFLKFKDSNIIIISSQMISEIGRAHV